MIVNVNLQVQREPTNIVVKIPTPQPPVERTHQPAPQVQYRQPQYIEVRDL